MADLTNILTGSYIEIAVVTDLGQATETETVVGYTMDETTVTFDSTDSEMELHENAITQRHSLHHSIDLEFMTAFTAGLEQLTTIGFTDAQGNFTKAPKCDLRLYVYDEPPADATAAGQVVEFTGCEVHMDEISLPTDGSEVNMVAYVNGGIKFAKTTAA